MMENHLNYLEFKNKKLFYVGGILATFMPVLLAMFFIFSDDFSYDEEILFRISGYLLLIFSIYLGYTFWKQKNFFIRVTESGISTNSINNINWNNIDKIEKKMTATRYKDVESLIISYKLDGENSIKKLIISEGQIKNYGDFKKIMVEKFPVFSL